MKFSVENEEKYTVIVSQVEKLDSISAPDLKSELVYLGKSGKRNIIIDLSESRYCDSSGLSALLTGNRLCKENSGSFVICGLQPSVEKLVKISQLYSVLNITPTRDEAKDMIMMEELERDLGDEKKD
ncbi:MAG: STAS domain-containing protein [Flavobacteriales bacterium]|nr:STAS domain-containing protein [Flavobacteriales bacterium]